MGVPKAKRGACVRANKRKLGLTGARKKCGVKGASKARRSPKRKRKHGATRHARCVRETKSHGYTHKQAVKACKGV